MTDMTVPKPPLGVGSIIGNTFHVWLRNVLPISLAGLIPHAIVAGIVLVLFGADVLLGQTPPAFLPGDATRLIVGNVAYGTLSLVAASITTAIVVRIAYDSASGRGVDLGAAVAGALPHVLPVAVLSLVGALAAGLAMILLIVPGLYLYAMWSVTAPAIVVENVGFGGLGRSAALTKHYRWPILGTIIILAIIMIVITLALAAVIAFVTAGLGIVAAVIIQILAYSMLYGPFYVLTAMIYARLREIKEGIAVQDLADVFA